MIKNKNKKLYFALIAICSIALFIIPCFPIQAGIFGDTAEGAIAMTIGLTCKVISIVLGLVLWIIGMIFDAVIQGTTLNDTIMNDVVISGWVIVRDIVNIVFVLAMLVIAFATILRIQDYQFKALLPKLLLAAFLVNFSKTIALTMVKFSDALMSMIIGTQGSNVTSAAIPALLNIDNLLQFGPDKSIFITDISVAANNVVFVFFLGMLCMALGGLAVLLITRIVVLMVLTVFAPVAFVFGVLPMTKKYADEWWENFIKFLFVGPVVCICYLLGLIFAVQFTQTGFEGLVGQLSQERLGITNADIPQLFGLLMACGFFMVGFVFTQRASGTMANASIGAVKKGLLGTGAFVGGMAGRWGMRRMSKAGRGPISTFAKNWAGKRGQDLKGKIATATSKGEGSLWQRAQLAVGQGAGIGLGVMAKAVRMAPSLPRAWKARQARVMEEYLEPAGGEGHDWMNKYLGFGEKTNFERRAEKGLIQKKMQEMAAKSSPEQVANILGARGFTEKAAGFRQAAASNDLNDMMNEPQFFNRHRKRFIEYSKGNMLLTEAGRDKFEGAFQTAKRAHKTDADAEVDARKALSDTDYLVSENSAPIYDPELLKEALYAELGGDTDQAGGEMADLSEICGEAGNIPLYGMASYDHEKKRFVKTDKATQSGVVEDKRRKMAGRKMSSMAHSNAYGRETVDGQLTDIHDEGWHLMMHDSWDNISKIGEHGRYDTIDLYESTGTTGKVNHEVIKKRALRATDENYYYSDKRKLRTEVGKIPATGRTTKQQKRVDYLQKELSTLVSRAQRAYGKGLQIQFQQETKMTDQNGADILADVRAAGGLRANEPMHIKAIKAWVEANVT